MFKKSASIFASLTVLFIKSECQRFTLCMQVMRRAYHPFKGPDLCHSDVVKCIVVTETGKIMSGG